MSKFAKGIFIESNMLGTPFLYKPVPDTTEEVKNARKIITPMYGVIHNAGSYSASSTDTALNDYMAKDDYKLWHFSVDRDSITQGLSTLKSGWHAGDGNGPGNTNSVGIEIADKGDDVEIQASISNAFKLMYAIEQEYPSIIWKPHQYFSPNKKECPKWILQHWGWDGFMAKYKAFVQSLTPPVVDPVNVLVHDLVFKGLTTDSAYWTGVLKGTTPVKLSNLVTLLQRAVAKIK